MATNSVHLIDHLDNSLSGKLSPETEQSILQDRESAQEWNALRQAVEALQHVGLYERVSAVKKQWMEQLETQAQPAGTVIATRPAGGVIRNMYRNAIRVAACFLVLAGGAAIFKYITISSPGLYEKYYSSYALSTTRGGATPDAMEQAFNEKNWTAVANLFNTAKEKNNKTYFLTGIADLELKKYDDAIGKFEEVIAVNRQTNSDYFQDEAEYYLAMSWLARNDVNEALPILERIKASKSHLYHETVEKMSFLSLRVVQYKDHK